MNYCIIDDEPIAHRIIEDYCKNLINYKKVGNCYDAFEAMELLQKETVDLIFLDINMPKLSGFDFLKTLPQPPNIIVTSAHQEYALEGYELNVTDYLLKPFSFERFVKAIQKIPARTDQDFPKRAVELKKDRLFVRGEKKIHQLHLENILYIESNGNYVKIYNTGETIQCYKTLSSFETLLPASDFMRIHRSYLVALDKIEVVEGNRIAIKDHIIPVGRKYQGDLLRVLFE